MLKEVKNMTLDRDKPQGVMHPVREVSIIAATRVALSRTNLLFLNAYVTNFNLQDKKSEFYGTVVSATL